MEKHASQLLLISLVFTCFLSLFYVYEDNTSSKFFSSKTRNRQDSILCLKFLRKTKLIDLTFTWMDSWMKDVSSALLVVYNRTLNENSLVTFWNAKRLLESLAINHYLHDVHYLFFVARFLTDKRIMNLMSTCCSVLVVKRVCQQTEHRCLLSRINISIWSWTWWLAYYPSRRHNVV